MRNLNNIEAKTILLLTEIELAMKDNGTNLPWKIVVAASKVRDAIHAEDAQLGADLAAMALIERKVSGSDVN